MRFIHPNCRCVFIGKAKDMTLKEIYFQFYFGRKIELLEGRDFSQN